MKQLSLFDVELATKEEEDQYVTIKNLREETRPFLTADMGPPYGVERIMYPPEVYVNSELNHTQLLTIMRDHELIPLYVGMDMMFVGWNEARLFFKSLLDKHLFEHWGIIATDVDREEGPENEEVWLPQDDI